MYFGPESVSVKQQLKSLAVPAPPSGSRSMVADPGSGLQEIISRLPDPSLTVVKTSLVGPGPSMAVMEISLTDPACDPLSPQRVSVPFEATLQPINSRLPLPLRTAVTMLLSSTAAIVTRLTDPACDPLS